MLDKLKGISQSMKRKGEQGFTLVELLVTAALITMISVMVVAIISSTTSTTDKFTTSNSAQEELSNGIAVVARELSTLKDVKEASSDKVVITNPHGDEIVYMYLAPEDAAAVFNQPVNNQQVVKKPKINSLSLVEIRAFAGGTNAIATVLTANVDPNQEDTGLPLFTYYTKRGVMTANDLNSDINRVAIRVTSSESARARSLELTTSVRLHQIVSAMTNSGGASEIPPPAGPLLKGSLPRPERVATLWWDAVIGADTYTLYRDGAAIATFGANDDLRYTDANRAWGTTYAYKVIASGIGGNSVDSNIVRLTVVPEKPAFLNVNPAAATCSGNTVARNLTNCLTWSQRVGAQGYRLYSTGTATPLQSSTSRSFSHSRNYGDVTTYYVIAWNTGEHGSGGNSITSDNVTLISPPKAVTLTGTHNNGDRSLTWSAPSYSDSTTNKTTGYRVYRATDSQARAELTNRTTVNYNDTTTHTSVNFNYDVVAYNAAGNSPTSNTVNLKPNPGAPTFTVTSQDGDRIITMGTRGTNGVSHPLERTAPTTKSLSTNLSTTYTDKEVLVNNNFGYRVRAVNKTGVSSWVTRSVNPRPATPVITVLDHDDNYDSGTNRITWTNTTNATSWKSQVRGGSVTDQTSRAFSHAAGSDSKKDYRVQACNYTGCSDFTPYETGMQKPGMFEIKTRESKQAGMTTYPDAGQYSQSRIAFEEAIGRFDWTRSSGADSVDVYRSGNLVSSAGNNTGNSGSYERYHTPGRNYTVVVRAIGDTTGLYRRVAAAVQSSPASMKDVYVRAQSTSLSSRTFNTRWWSNSYASVEGDYKRGLSLQSVGQTNGFRKDDDDVNDSGSWGVFSASKKTTANKQSGAYTTGSASMSNWVGGVQLVQMEYEQESGYSTFDRVNPREGAYGNNTSAAAESASTTGVSWVTFTAMRVYNAGGFWARPCYSSNTAFTSQPSFRGYYDFACVGSYGHSAAYNHEAGFARKGDGTGNEGSTSHVKRPSEDYPKY